MRSTHVELDFAVDFDQEVFEGVVTHWMTVVNSNVSSVFMDAEGMSISKVEYMGPSTPAWTDIDFNVTRPNNNLGYAVEAHLPHGMDNGTNIMLKLTYITNANTTAISWLKPSQTAGKKLPYLFTQCEDIACRSVAPMQDTPANKFTYNATVKVKNEFKVYMSANSTGVSKWNDTHTAFTFQNDIKMASYLIAVAVGDLEYRELGDRTGVITEPCFMDAVADELVSLPSLLDKAEQYLGPYIWGNYTILVLPPSFPMGGMENPLLTFASPTIITGDKSQVYVATHEIAHSWTGNEITCENWSNFWLNEGFTVFEERKVSGEIHGEDFSKVNAYIGNISMYDSMLSYGLNNSYSSIYPIINDDKPDNSFSVIPYEKGYQLIYYLETLLGKEDVQNIIQMQI